MRSRLGRIALWFIRRTCSDPFLDELEGDLIELQAFETEELGAARAQRRFIWRAFTSPRWYRLRGLDSNQFTPMWKNHFRMAYRHALRHRTTAIIHFSGLFIGILATLFIALYIKNELAYDRMHVQADRIYRLLQADPITGDRSHQ